METTLLVFEAKMAFNAGFNAAHGGHEACVYSSSKHKRCDCPSDNVATAMAIAIV
jgi:hypothetical protein